MLETGALPVLAEIAVQHLTIAEAGALVKWVFSISGNIYVPSQAHLDTKTIFQLVLVHHWLTNDKATVNDKDIAWK